jgi:hypothetical protein
MRWRSGKEFLAVGQGCYELLACRARDTRNQLPAAEPRLGSELAARTLVTNNASIGATPPGDEADNHMASAR